MRRACFRNHQSFKERSWKSRKSNWWVTSKNLKKQYSKWKCLFLAFRQIYKNNPSSGSGRDYWKSSLNIPYLDSLLSSINVRFSHDNEPAFALTKLHPSFMLKMSISDFQKYVRLPYDGVKDVEITNILREATVFLLWHYISAYDFSLFRTLRPQ